MTLFHFGNCLALSYAPYFIAYRYSSLPEYNAFWKCLRAGLAYLATQAVKMVVLATFFASSEGVNGNSKIDFNVEVMKGTMDLLDFLGLYVIMQRLRVTGQGELKILAVGLGWGCAELLCTQLLPLWVQARGTEFTWANVQTALDSNIGLIQHLTRAGLVWLWMRTDLKKRFLPLVVVLMAVLNYRSMQSLALLLLTDDVWMQLLAKFVYSVVASSITFVLFLTVIAK
ncbi:BOS complex subunit TMEM147-like [Sycon ciliatum]|uniref:BOS complex subunit TMEM147-like n=1 Tax=Sycon ciliatum TaxID=27933 RepID=UPI0020ACDF36|eukprot:scpid68743/ scgid7404/ Transmembrane protein 147